MTIKKKDTEKNKNPFISTSQLAQFNNGTNFRTYEFMGAIPSEIYGESGYSFAVWAPNAKSVSVVGDFNGWDTSMHPMNPQGSSGVRHCFIKNVKEGQCYKFYIETKDGTAVYKADPYARLSQMPPETASVIYDVSGFRWTDESWMKKRAESAPYSKPMLIYEMHLGSWRTNPDGSLKNYTEAADELCAYLKEMSYTHVELMPLTVSVTSQSDTNHKYFSSSVRWNTTKYVFPDMMIYGYIWG